MQIGLEISISAEIGRSTPAPAARLGERAEDGRGELGGGGGARDGDEEDAARKEAALVQVVGRGEGERGLAHARRADEREQPLLLTDGGRDELLHLGLAAHVLQREESGKVMRARRRAEVTQRALGQRLVDS